MSYQFWFTKAIFFSPYMMETDFHTKLQNFSNMQKVQNSFFLYMFLSPASLSDLLDAIYCMAQGPA